MTLDIESGVRSEEVVGAIAYDTLWQGMTNADYRILVNGVVLSTGSGAGTVAWHPTKYGTYALTYQVFVDNVKVGEDMFATFVLAGKDLVNAEITLASEEVLYDGTARCPKVTVVYQDETLAEGVDYTLEYENNIEPGVATMTIRGKGRFSDVLEKNFTIRPAGICSLDIESGTRIAREVEPLTYDSSWFADASSSYKMYVDGKDLSQGAGVGAYNWVPRAVGDHLLTYRSYSGGYLVSDEYQARFHVNGRDLVHATITFNDKTILYDGTERKPSITLTLAGKTLVEGVDYSLSYSNNINPGVGIITVTGLGSYVDILDVPFTIRPAGICFLDIESGTRKAKPTEHLAYDDTWAGNTNGTTRMSILVNDVDEVIDLTGVGTYAWTPLKGGAYVVKLRTYVDGSLMEDQVETAYFDVAEKIAPKITFLKAAPRYPWNGKVDIDLTFTGENREYAVRLVAKDLVGGTNLAVRTVCVDAVVPTASSKDDSTPSDAIGTIASTGGVPLRPGTYRLTWDADADIAGDADFERVSMSVRIDEP